MKIDRSPQTILRVLALVITVLAIFEIAPLWLAVMLLIVSI